MDLLTKAELRTLLAEHEGPCVSIYMPAHRGGDKQDSIRFQNLLHQAEDRLIAQGMRAPDARDFVAPLRAAQTGIDFWSKQSDGLAAFLARDFQGIYRLPWAFQEEVQVAGLFLVTPLLPLLRGNGRFMVLALSRNRVRLFQGTRFTVSEVEIPGVPKNIEEALRNHDRDEVLTFHTRPTSSGGWGAIFEGHGVGIDDAKDDLLRYFQQIDRGLHSLLKDEQVPLVLAAVDYLHPIYRQANTYSHLEERGIDGNPDRMSGKDLHDRAWAILSPQFEKGQQESLARYQQIVKKGNATDDLAKIIPAAYRGELQTLFVASNRSLWGTVGKNRDQIAIHDQPEVSDENLTNFATVHTLRHENTVHVLPLEEMPSGASMAAIYHATHK
jgi:hypothetical protein